MTDSFVGRGNQYVQLVKVQYCKRWTIHKQPPLYRRQSKIFILIMVNLLIYKKSDYDIDFMYKVVECLTRFEGFWWVLI